MRSLLLLKANIFIDKNVQSVLSVLSVKIFVQYVYDLQNRKNKANLKACFVNCVHGFKKAATTPDIVTIVSFDVKTIYSQLIYTLY